MILVSYLMGFYTTPLLNTRERVRAVCETDTSPASTLLPVAPLTAPGESNVTYTNAVKKIICL